MANSPGAAKQLKQLDALVEQGPDIATHGVVRWRCVDLQSVIAETFEVTMSERHVGRMLRKRGFTRLSARPRHPKTDEAAQEAFKKTSPRRSPTRCRPQRRASPSRFGSRTKPASDNKEP